MNKGKLPVAIRRTGLLLATAGLTACAAVPPPVVVMAPPQYAPPVYVQASPVQPVAPAQPAPVQTVPTAPQARILSDGAIAGIMEMANNAEIHEAQLALSVSRDPRVRNFARQMITDHSRLNVAMMHLTSRLGITPTQSPASRNIQVTARQAYSQLSALRGSAFNRTYVNHQVTTHTRLLNGMNRYLIPNARNPQLRSALLQARPTIAVHLQHARGLAALMR